MTRSNARTGGQILIDQLVAQGVERVTCVPGESYLAALDALHDSAIDVMICRAEGGAAMMAEATASSPDVRASASSPAAPARPMPRMACTSRCRIPPR